MWLRGKLCRNMSQFRWTLSGRLLTYTQYIKERTSTPGGWYRLWRHCFVYLSTLTVCLQQAFRILIIHVIYSFNLAVGESSPKLLINKVRPWSGHKSPERGVEAWLYSFFKLGARCGLPHALAALPLAIKPSTHCIDGWVGFRAGLDGRGKFRLHRDSIPGPSNS
jgi:hypothetical protein